MASINDLSLAKGLTAKVEEACAGLETGEAPILDHVSEITAAILFDNLWKELNRR